MIRHEGEEYPPVLLYFNYLYVYYNRNDCTRRDDSKNVYFYISR